MPASQLIAANPQTFDDEEIQGTVDAALEAFGDNASKEIAARMLWRRGWSEEGKKFWFAVWKRLNEQRGA